MNTAMKAGPASTWVGAGGEGEELGERLLAKLDGFKKYSGGKHSVRISTFFSSSVGF